ncbi:MAG: hypothetical protein OXI63_23435, partial [Candidatus Poribacteria bacterium]|nr:hypothetical protein [Candidatus Poribacteria bacterium]
NIPMHQSQPMPNTMNILTFLVIFVKRKYRQRLHLRPKGFFAWVFLQSFDAEDYDKTLGFTRSKK